MPKEPATRRAKASRVSPTKAAPRKDPATKSKASEDHPGKPDANAKNDPKASHLYTDNNPSTTIHGTGFKDAATAQHTLQLIARRSLTYQFQTVNTLYNRAKHHPAMKKSAVDSDSTADMRAAMDVFKEWLDVTYPAEKAGLRAGGFKPLLSKKVVERYLERIEGSTAVREEGKAFARMYCSLAKGKRLGNVLVDDAKPEEPDWERRRYEVLDELVEEGKEEGEKKWGMSELWTEERSVSEEGGHLELVAWGWSPVAEGKLP